MIHDADELKLAYPFIEKELSFSCSDLTEEVWMKAFTKRINDLILYDFNMLVSLLYRLDISETRLRKILKDQTYSDSADTAEIICRMIIERQIEKIRSRKQYRNDGKIDEDEKW